MSQSAPSRPVMFTLLGLPWTRTAQTIPFVLTRLALGLIAAWLLLPLEAPVMRVIWGLIYGVLIIGIQVIHTVGHILSSKRVSPPMREVRSLMIGFATLYPREAAPLPGSVHLTRSLGGPIINVLVGIAALILSAILGGHVLGFFGAANILLALAALLPLPMIDGGVIWRELGNYLGD